MHSVPAAAQQNGATTLTPNQSRELWRQLKSLYGDQWADELQRAFQRLLGGLREEVLSIAHGAKTALTLDCVARHLDGRMGHVVDGWSRRADRIEITM